MSQKILTSIDELDSRFGLSPGTRDRMETLCEKFPFRASEYYLSLIDWENRNDPIHRIVIPDPRELKGGGSWIPPPRRITRRCLASSTSTPPPWGSMTTGTMPSLPTKSSLREGRRYTGCGERVRHNG